MKERLIAVVALAISVVALIRPSFKSGDAERRALREELAALHEKVTGLEEHLAQVTVTQQNSSTEAAAANAQQQTQAAPDQLRKLQQHLMQMDQRLLVAEQKATEATSRTAALSANGIVTATQAELDEFKKAAINPQSEVQHRLRALRALRRADARTPEVVQAMIELQATTTDPAVRADIFRQLSGVTDPGLKQPLMEGLLPEQHAQVREEAAETLAHFLTDPNVEAALVAIAENDPSERVRRQALESLERKGAR